MNLPSVSVIVLNYNGERFIKNCLDSLNKINFDRSYEIIVVDNDSTDSSVDIIKGYEPYIKLIETGKNLGYAGGNNVGVDAAKGKYIVFLNPDTKVDENFLKGLVDAMENNKDVGAFSSKVLYHNEGDKVNTIGGFWSILGTSGSVGEGQKSDEFNEVIHTFYPTGSAMIMEKKVYLEMGRFDNDYFLYCEDPDIGWKLWDSGYKVALAPKSKVYHLVSGSLKGLGKNAYSDMFYFYNARNGLLTIVKNATVLDLLWMVPVYIFSWLSLSALFFVRGKFRAGKAVVKGVMWPIAHLGWTLGKRMENRNKRTGKAKVMMTGISQSLKIFFGSKIEKHFK